MSKQAQNSMGLGIVLLFAGIVLMSDPQCGCGCKTVAEHLFKAGIDLLAS